MRQVEGEAVYSCKKEDRGGLMGWQDPDRHAKGKEVLWDLCLPLGNNSNIWEYLPLSYVELQLVSREDISHTASSQIC